MDFNIMSDKRQLNNNIVQNLLWCCDSLVCLIPIWNQFFFLRKVYSVDKVNLMFLWRPVIIYRSNSNFSYHCLFLSVFVCVYDIVILNCKPLKCNYMTLQRHISSLFVIIVISHVKFSSAINYEHFCHFDRVRFAVVNIKLMNKCQTESLNVVFDLFSNWILFILKWVKLCNSIDYYWLLSIDVNRYGKMPKVLLQINHIVILVYNL